MTCPVIKSSAQEPITVKINRLLVQVMDFGYIPGHVNIPFGCKVTWEVGAAELGSVQYLIVLTSAADNTTIATSPPIMRGENFSYTFLDVGRFWVSDPVFTDMRR